LRRFVVTTKQFYMAKVNKTGLDPKDIVRLTSAKDSNECWIWSGRRDKKGYGKIYYEKTHWVAHRFAYKMFIGDPAGFQVMHNCNNPSCVNPDHLHLGTNQDNVDYREAFGRGAFKKNHLPKNSILTNEEANKIKKHIREYRGMQTCQQMADLFGVKKSLIVDIRNGRSYINSRRKS
jgi:hypothetical protein